MKTLFKALRALPPLSTLAAFLCLAPLASRAQDFTYTTNNDTITITAYTGSDGHVNIPSTINDLPVTTIGNRAFYENRSLTSVTIPESVSHIGDEAFFLCTGLTNVTLPNSLTHIGSWAFELCTSLTSIALPNSLTSLAHMAFYASGLTNIVVPGSVTDIGDKVFEWCTNLTTVTIGHGATNIAASMFESCVSLTSVTIPESVSHIGDEAFFLCTGLTNVTLPNSLTSLGHMAFYFCTNLASAFFGGDVPSLGSDAFGYADNATVYYLPGTTGWGQTFGGRPTALWHLPQPVILGFGPSFGLRTNQFGFIISWATNASIVVEASSNLTGPAWSPVSTNAVTDGWSHFSDPEWMNYPARFYRIRSP